MTTLTAPAPRTERPTENGKIPPLYNGDRLSQPEFHRRYEAMPQGVKAELIEGIVYMASPVGRRHGQGQIRLGGLLWLYENGTPGVEALDNATVILGDESEPQPDLHLRILPDFGGRVIESERGILEGAPELVAEVAHSSESIDLHAKRRDYESAGVLEYVVLIVREGRLRAFDLSSGLELKESSDGIYRSKTFPGLWLDIAAIVAGDGNRAHRALNKGLKSPERTAFVKRLKKAQDIRRRRRK